MNIAVVGAGVAGLVSAHLLSRRHAVTLFEQDARLGGNTNTVVLAQGPDQGLAVDTGFIVLNNRTYPLFHRFLAELGVAVRSADMSFAYLDERGGFCRAGTNLNGLFAQRRKGTATGLSLGQWMDKEGFRGAVVEHYIVPMGAAIWSAPYGRILDFPAETYLRFFSKHGLLGLTGRPQWQTVVGGSHAYLWEARTRKLKNVRVITRDLRSFQTRERFNRVVSVEMFEHMRNWQALMSRIDGWLKPGGTFFMHVFTHHESPYLFETQGADDWMGRHFFTGGMMPSDALPLHVCSPLAVADHWRIAGTHYGRTAEAWLGNMDAHKAEIMELFEKTYGAQAARRWWNYCRVFFMACGELWNFQNSEEWLVNHYLFEKARAKRETGRAAMLRLA